MIHGECHQNLGQMLQKKADSIKLQGHPKVHIKILNQTHLKQIADLQISCDDGFQPLTLAYYQQYPERVDQDAPFWKLYLESYSAGFLTNGCSVGLFDSEKDKLISVILGLDVNYIPSNFQIDIANRNKMLQAITELENQMYKKMPAVYQPIFKQKGVILEIWNVAIHPDHMGKRLMYPMIQIAQALGIFFGYKYSLAYCTNFKSAKAFKRMKYEKLSDFNAKQFQFQGKKILNKLDEKQPLVSLWLKPLIYTPDSIIGTVEDS